MKVPIIIHADKFEITEYWRTQIKKEVKDHEGPIRAEIQTLLPESRAMRGYVNGGLIPLLVYLDGNDYKKSDVCEFYFWHYKKEFTPEAIKVGGKIELKPKSSKGAKALKVFADKIQDYLDENHGIPYDSLVTNPEHYKNWRDTISMDSTDTYIEYCQKLKLI